MEITNDTFFTKSDDVLEASMDDAMALMSMENGKYYGLNGVGKTIWELIENRIQFAAIIEELVSRFDVDKSTCEAEAKSFLIELAKRKVIIAE